MQKRLVAFVFMIFLAAFWMVQRAPDSVSAVAAPSPLVVIDPGHGGWDPGAVRGAVYEKALTLAVALKVGTLLQQRGIRVYYTRRTDTALSNTVLNDLTYRAALANRLGASLFVSIHVNSEPTGSVAGPIVYYSRASWPSYRLAQTVTNEVHRTTGTEHPPRPIRQWVLLRSRMPAVNVEIGFISHSKDAAKLQTSPYQRVMAEAIARGLSRYLGYP